MLNYSHSMVGTWNRCHRKWSFIYREGWRQEGKSKALTLGIITHELLANYYTYGEPGYRDRLNQYIGAQINANPEWVEEISHVVRVLDRYINDYAPLHDEGWSILDVEKRYELEFTSPNGVPYTLVFVMDVVARNPKGKTFIWDHKSHSSDPWTLQQVDMDSQLPLYNAGLRAIGIPVGGFLINCINVYNYKRIQDFMNKNPNDLFKRIPSSRTDTELANIIQEFGFAVDEIHAASEGSIFRKTLNKDCSFCEFIDPCMMETRGHSVEPFLQGKFTNKLQLQVKRNELTIL